MADTIDSISIELTASTKSAEDSIQRVIDMLRMLKAATIDASVESRIGKSIRSIAKAAREIDSDAGQKLARLAGGLNALSKVGDLSNLADAGKNLSSVVRAVNSMGQSGGKGLSNLANGIKQTSDALGSIKDADVSKLNAVKDALSGEMSGSLHSSSRVSESASLGGMGTPEPSFGNMAAYGAMTVFKYTADSIRDAITAYREFGAALAGGGSTVDTQFTDSMMTVFKYTADSIRDATAAYREFQAALGSGVPPIFTNFADDAARAGGSVRMLTGNVGSNNEGPWVADEIRDAARAYDDVGNSASAAAQVIETEFVNPTGAAFSTLNNIIWGFGNAISHIGSGFSGIGSMLGMVGQAASTVGGGFMQFTGIAGFAKDILFGIGNDADTARNKMGGLAKAVQNVGGAFTRYGFAAIPKYFGGQLIGNIQKATKGLTGFFHSIVRIAKYRLIRTALRMITQGINEGIKNLYAFSQAAGGTFASSMNQIATASKYLGNSFAAMASPLVEALAPAIDFIVDKFVDMFNTISQIIARLTGKSTYTVAKKVASSWGDAAKSASSGAKDAADEIKRTIMGFDEINKLSKESSSSGGGGGGGGSGGGASSMFEEMPIDGAVASFADSLKEAFLAGDWQELGTLLGNKVNELVDSIDWGAAGATVGYYINGWFSTKYWTLETINFTNIGSKIAEFLNNAIAEIDFSIIGASLVQKLTIIGDLIIGFFTDFDFGQAAESFSAFVMGIYKQITKWLEKHDWGAIGETIVQKITDFFTSLDYAGVASSFAEFMGAALGAGAKLITGLGKAIGEKIGEAFNGIGEFFQEQIEACGGDIVGGILRGIILGLVNIGVWIVENIFKPFIEGFKKAFGIASPAKEMYGPGEDIMNGVLQGILNVMSTIGQWIIDNVFDAITKAFTLAESVVKSLAAIGETIINTVLGGILNVMGGIVAWVATNIIKPLMDAFTKNDEEDQGEDFSSKLWEAIKEKWNSDNRQLTVKLIANKNANDIWNTISSDWNAIEDKNVTFGITLDTTASKVWEVFKTAWDALTSRRLTFDVAMSTTASAIWSAFITAWEAAGSKTLFFTPKLDNAAAVIYANFKSEWDSSGSKTLYFTPKLDNSAAVLYTNFKAEWDAQGSKVLYFSPKLDNGADTLYANFKSEWDAQGSKILYLSPKLNNTGTVLWNGFKKEWDDAATGLYVTPKLSNKGSVLWAAFKKEWDEAATGLYAAPKLSNQGGVLWAAFKKEWDAAATNLYVSPQLNNKGSTLWNTFKGEWDKAATNLYVAAKLNNTGTVLWNTFKGEWDKAATAFSVKIKLEKDGWSDVDSFIGFGGATGGGGSSSGGGAGRKDHTRSVPISLEKTWTGTPQSALGLEGLSATVTIGTNLLWAAVGILAYLALTNLKTDVTVDLAKEKKWADNGWSGKLGLNNMESTVTVSLEKEKKWADNGWSGRLGLNNMEATIKVDLAKLWKKPALDELGLYNLKTKVKVSLNKQWKKSVLDELGLYNLTAQIKVKLVKGSPNKVEVSKDGDTAWSLSVKKLGGIFANGIWKSLPQFAKGGVFSSGFWRNLPKYASGTANAHGSMFLAGEAGPELVGHVGGRTEVLNQSQLAATMFSAVRAAMGGVKIAATMYDGGDSGEGDYETMYRAMYDAFTAAMAGSDARDQEKVQLMRQIAAKEFTAEVTAASVNRAQTRMNRRSGTTIVPVGT